MPVVSVGLVAYGLFVRHGEVVNVEAMGVLHARRFASHEPVYRSWQHFPHAVAPYGPANYAVPGLLTRWLGLSIQGTFLAMRSVSLVAFTLLVAIILVTVAPRAGAAGAAACAALLVGADVMTQFAVCGRPDLASLCLQAAGLAILDRRRGTVATALLAAPFLLLACSFKQVAVIATIAAAAWLAASDRAGWRPAIALLAAVLAPLLGLAAIGEYATGGALLENTVASQAFPHGIANMIALLPAVLPVAPFLVAGLAALIVPAARRLMGPFAAYFVMGSVWAIAGTYRAGSWVNYLFEIAIAGSVALGCLLRAAPRLGGALLLSSATVVLATSAPRLPARVDFALDARKSARETDELYSRMSQDVAAGRGTLVTDDPYLALVSGRPEAATDGFHVAGLVAMGLLSDAEGTELVARKAADPIVLTSQASQGDGLVPSWPPAWRAAMEGRYRRVRSYPSGHAVYRPRAPQGPPRP